MTSEAERYRRSIVHSKAMAVYDVVNICSDQQKSKGPRTDPRRTPKRISFLYATHGRCGGHVELYL